jgi:hypothetical protein
MLTLVYIAFAVLGCGYVLVTALLGYVLDAFDSGGDGMPAMLGVTRRRPTASTRRDTAPPRRSTRRTRPSTSRSSHPWRSPCSWGASARSG